MSIRALVSLVDKHQFNTVFHMDPDNIYRDYHLVQAMEESVLPSALPQVTSILLCRILQWWETTTVFQRYDLKLGLTFIILNIIILCSSQTGLTRNLPCFGQAPVPLTQNCITTSSAKGHSLPGFSLSLQKDLAPDLRDDSANNPYLSYIPSQKEN